MLSRHYIIMTPHSSKQNYNIIAPFRFPHSLPHYLIQKHSRPQEFPEFVTVTGLQTAIPIHKSFRRSKSTLGSISKLMRSRLSLNIHQPHSSCTRLRSGKSLTLRAGSARGCAKVLARREEMIANVHFMMMVDCEA